MTAEIISVGTELLLGNILNTNAQYLSQELAQLGITVQRQSTIGDNHDRLAQFVQEAKSRCDLLVFTGGLGPTADDLTKETVAACFGDMMRQSGRRSPLTLPAPAAKLPPTTASRQWCRCMGRRSKTAAVRPPVHGLNRRAAMQC